MMEWSEMLPEVLDIIAQKYITCYEDYPSFAGVCRSWHLAAARTYHNSNGPPSRLPSLMLAGKSDDHESRELFLLSNKRTRKIRLPEAYGKICVSSCGWLLTIGKDCATQLINPLSREIINLPKVDTFPHEYPLDWDGSISQVVLLMESKLVLVMYDLPGEAKLGFCHIGDNEWKSVEQPLDNSIFDIIFYNGQVYAFGSDTIQTCNVNGKHPSALVDVAMIPEDFDELDGHRGQAAPYIAGLDDGERKQVLLIMRFFNRNKTKGFKVLAYDLESGNWSKVKDFGRKTLFVGLNSSFWTEDTTGVIKGNCIYYTEGGWKDTGIYHISDGTIEPHFTGESCCDLTPLCESMIIWLQSM